MLRLRIFGGLSVEGASRHDAAANRRRPLMLLALLAIAGPRGMSRSKLAVYLWPESSEEHARNSLSQALSALRRQMGTEQIVLGAAELRLNPDCISSDVQEFDAAVDAADPARAVAAYTGDLLDGVFLRGVDEVERWIEQERNRRRESYLDCLRTLADAASARGHHADAIRWARLRAANAPLDSRGAVDLMRVMVAAGDTSGALQHFNAHRALARTDLGVEPAPSVAAFAAEVRASSRPGCAPASAPAIEPPPRATPDQPAVSAPNRSSTPWRNNPLSRAFAAAFAAALAAIAAAVWWMTTAQQGATTGDWVIAVLPFKLTAPDSSLNYFREGAINVINARLTGDAMPRGLDSRVVLKALGDSRTGAELTAQTALTVGKRYRTRHVLLGELVVTPSETRASARLLRVPDGTMVAEHSINGTASVPLMLDRLLSRLLASAFGESAARVGLLSDSSEAVQAYLVGLQHLRAGETRIAVDRFNRALEIDPAFAAAAFWSAIANGWNVTYAAANHRADSIAWSLRQRFVHRDRLILASLPTIGPNYPRPATATEYLAAFERAARANPDRVEAWVNWGEYMAAYGPQAGLGDALFRAAIILDSAIALDSAHVRPHRLRFEVAVLNRDTTAVRRHRAFLFSAMRDTVIRPPLRWVAARALNDTTRLASLLNESSALFLQPNRVMLGFSVFRGWTLDDVESVTMARMANTRLQQNERSVATGTLAAIAAIRGEAARANALFYPVREQRQRQPDRVSHITRVLADGDDHEAAREAAEDLAFAADTAKDPATRANAHCYSQLWRVARADTSGSRRAIAAIRALVRSLPPGPAFRVGQLQLCPLVLEAALERVGARAGAPRPSLDRLEAMLLRGSMVEWPSNLAYLMAASWLEETGHPVRAYAVIRRRLVHFGNLNTIVEPASLAVEGRLAESVGDRQAAIDAYSRVVTIRDRPDRGVLTKQVRAIQVRLNNLRAAEQPPKSDP